MLRTPEQFKSGLRDGRVVYWRGERVDDVSCHPDLRVGVDHVCLDFTMAEDPQTRDLFTTTDAFPFAGEDGPSAACGDSGPVRYSRYFKLPMGVADLLLRSEMIEASTRAGMGVVPLIKEIGTDALFALRLIAEATDRKQGTDYLDRVRRFHERCCREDLAFAVAQTDVKGNRSLGPSQQSHPDYYVHIVERRPDGIVVRGAKAHTTGTPHCDEIIAIPTRALDPGDADYAVAFAVQPNAPGLRMICSPYGSTTSSAFHNPVSSSHHLVETLTVFDDVFVPNERVFLCGEADMAGPLALTFVEYHRFTAVSYKPPILDLLIGASALMAEFNGISRASHVREKMFRMIQYVETIRALTRASAHECQPRGDLVVPNTVYTNLCKYFFATHFHEFVREAQDIAGGLLVTGPAEEDLANPETREDLIRYFGGNGVDGETRLRLINLIRDLCASDFGGYHEVLAIHAEGSLEAQKITIARGFDIARCVAFAREAAGI